MDIFGGRAGPQLLPLLKMGEAGIVDLMEEAKRLNITMSTESAKAAADFTDAMTRLKGSLAGAGRTIGDTLIPIITPLIEKATEIIVKIKAWAEENSGLVEGILKWGAGIGVLMLVLGPLLMILPSVIAGVILLKGAFMGLVATGAIIAVTVGIMKLTDVLRESVGGMREFREKLKVMKEVKEVDAVISDLTETASQLLATYYDKGWDKLTEHQKKINKGYQIWKTTFDELAKRENLALERREELIYFQETGVELTYEEIKTLRELNKKIEEEKKRIDALIESIKGEIAGVDELSYQMKILTAEYELTNKTIEDTTKHYQDMLDVASTRNSYT
jgi:Sec-independent protein translocase protein TatA